MRCEGGAVSDDLTHWCERAVELGADQGDHHVARPVVTVSSGCASSASTAATTRRLQDLPAERRPPARADAARCSTSSRRACCSARTDRRRGEQSDPESRRLNDAALELERELFLGRLPQGLDDGRRPLRHLQRLRRWQGLPDPREGASFDGGLRRRRLHDRARRGPADRGRAEDRDDEYRFFALVLVD